MTTSLVAGAAGIASLAVSPRLHAGALWTVYYGDFASWSAAVSAPREYTFAGTGLSLGANIADLYSADGIKMSSTHWGEQNGYSFPALLDASLASDPDGFAVHRWDWTQTSLRFRFDTPIRAIFFDTGGYSESTRAWSDDGSISGFVANACVCNHGIVFDVPVTTVVVSAPRIQDFHVEFVPAPGGIPALLAGAGLFARRRRR